MQTKKIIFVIVEGPSEDTALGVILNRIYDQNEVHVHIMYGDITSEHGVSSNNIVAKIGKCIKEFAGRVFKPEHFSQIIHIVDTDGAFIANSNIIKSENQNTLVYSTTGIYASNKSDIENRNLRKRENLSRLISTSTIWNIPYNVYYMSCNLDHVLYDKLNSSDSEKELNSVCFAKKYKNNTNLFLNFIANSDFSVMNSYSESWQFIKKDLHSLERHTNLGLCFKE